MWPLSPHEFDTTALDNGTVTYKKVQHIIDQLSKVLSHVFQSKKIKLGSVCVEFACSLGSCCPSAASVDLNSRGVFVRMNKCGPATDCKLKMI